MLTPPWLTIVRAQCLYSKVLWSSFQVADFMQQHIWSLVTDLLRGQRERAERAIYKETDMWIHNGFVSFLIFEHKWKGDSMVNNLPKALGYTSFSWTCLFGLFVKVAINIGKITSLCEILKVLLLYFHYNLQVSFSPWNIPQPSFGTFFLCY